MIRKIIISLLFLFFALTADLSAQLTVNATARAASCSANGQIDVQVTGGSGNYTYQLKSSCIDNIPPQQEAAFDFLPPCEYTVSVVDRETNAAAETVVEVTGDYEEIRLSVAGEGCDQRLIVTGGRAPFRFSYSPDGVGGPYQPNDPDTSSLFTNLSGSDIHLSVEDACGVRRAIPTPSQLNPIQSVEFPESTEEGIPINVIGGEEPYTYRVFNEADTLTLTRPFITWDSLLCNPLIEVRDGCSSFVTGVYYQPRATVNCVNFAEGTAEVQPVAGIPPYTFKIVTPESEFLSGTGIFENLPVNAEQYTFSITDACGLEVYFDTQTRLRLDVAETGLGCSDEELQLFVARQCAGLPFGPLQVTCQNCLPQETVEVNSLGEGITFSGYGPGEWDILLENSCGDQTRCRDELVVELTPGCDSIVARIVDLFSCDNGTTGRRVITGDDATFFLMDENGTLLVENNKTGVFENLAQGDYEVTVILPDCDTLRSTATLAPAEAIDPYLFTNVDYSVEEQSCRLFYNLFIEKTQGPYVLTGGPDGRYYEVLNNFSEDNCQYYQARLRPGVYNLTSMSACGSREITLPEPDYDFQVSLAANCPNDAKLLAGGIRTVEEWTAYFEPYQINVQNIFPGYFVETTAGGSRQEVDFTFRGLGPGPHTVYLYPLEETACPVDTITIDIPEYEPVSIGIDGDVVCDDKSTTDLDIQLAGGQAPYDLRKLDCQTGGTLASFEVDSTGIFVDESLPLGGYCYAVSDVCQLSADFQVKVRLFADSIRVQYDCDGMLQLSVDSLPVSYSWVDSRGQVLGDQHVLRLPLSDRTETYTVRVALPECEVERSVTVASREIIPAIDMAHNGRRPVICGDGELMLTAMVDNNYPVSWSNGAAGADNVVTEPGVYIATVANDIGCTNSDTLNVEQVGLPAPEILGVLGYCQFDSTELTLDQSYEERRWSTGEETESITLSTAGPVWVQVTDENGCMGQDSVIVEEWSLPEPLIQADTLICPAATAAATTVTDYVSYAWSDGTILPAASLPAGTHTVTVTDTNGCRGADDILITEKIQIFARFDGDTTLCAGDVAALSVSFTPPWRPTEFTVRGAAGENLQLQTFGDTTFSLPVNFTTTLSLENISMPDYGCPVIAQGTPRIHANRLNLVFREDPIRCPGGSDGALEAVVSSDFPPYDIDWSNGGSGSRIQSLPEGSYSVTAIDQLGCIVTDSFNLRAPAPIRPRLTLMPPLCRDIDDGSISLDAVAGGAPPFTWRLNETDQGRAPGEATDLPPDTYLIALLDQNACAWDSTVVFPVPPSLSLDAGEDQVITIGESVRLEPVTSIASLVYWRWEALPKMEMDSSLVLEVSPFEKTDFTITVLNDYGCSLTDEVSVFVNKDDQFDAPNAFSPNGDGRNDFFLLYGKESNIEGIDLFEIYDRWGNKIFSTENMEINNELTGWDGRQNGRLLSSGVYVWMAKVRRVDGEVALVYGDVALMR
jgi:gliding motility-associated-like protein